MWNLKYVVSMYKQQLFVLDWKNATPNYIMYLRI